jgi:large subunit ribosomal protein L9
MAKTKDATKGKGKPAAKALPQKKVKVRQQIKKGAHGGVQVVLVEDVTHVGKQGQVVEVKPGYARNYLLPNGFAIIPSEHNLRLLERYKVRVEQAREARKSDLKALAEQIARTKTVTIEANATEDGHLYGSVGPQEIARAMRGKNLLVDPDMIKLPEPLKELGYDIPVPINLGHDI